MQILSMPRHERHAEAARVLAPAEPDSRPEPLDYLYEYFLVLGCMRDVDGMVGRKRMTPTFIKDAADLFGWHLSGDEALALAALDAAELFPGKKNPMAENEGDDGSD